MNEDETIAPLPTKGVTFKDFNAHLPDIKEATLEGSQFEAPAYTGALVPQYQANTAQPGTNKEPLDSDNGNTGASRPKTSIPRRTNSEKSLKDEDIPKTSTISRKPTQENLRPDTITPRKRTPDLTEVNGHGNISDRRGSNSQISRKTPICETPDIRSTSRISRKGTNGDIHSHGHLSRKGTNSEIPQSRKGVYREPTRQSALKQHVDGENVTPESREVVQRKGKVVTDAW